MMREVMQLPRALRDVLLQLCVMRAKLCFRSWPPDRPSH